VVLVHFKHISHSIQQFQVPASSINSSKSEGS
jgi:hypothetical protein